MSIKKSIAVMVIGLILTSCASRGWSCKSRYVNAKPVVSEKKTA